MAKTEHRRIIKKRLYVAQECRCFYCDKAIHIEDATIDHLVPVAKGGADHWQNHVVACAPCNGEKSHGDLTTLGAIKAARVHNRYRELKAAGYPYVTGSISQPTANSQQVEPS
jgi:5-methylcytosine-specific restriction endonuclease McrA